MIQADNNQINENPGMSIDETEHRLEENRLDSLLITNKGRNSSVVISKVATTPDCSPKHIQTDLNQSHITPKDRDEG